MDCLHRHHLQVLLHITTDHILATDIQIGKPHTTIMKKGTDAVDPDHIHIITDTTAKVTIIPTEAILGHTIRTIDDITEVIHDAHTQIHISTTPHRRSS